MPSPAVSTASADRICLQRQLRTSVKTSDSPEGALNARASCLQSSVDTRMDEHVQKEFVIADQIFDDL